jgi:hypothetical protein
MSDEEQARREEPDASQRPDAGSGTPDGPDAALQDDAASGAVLRLIGAVVTLPWLLLYGVTGVWAVILAARAASQGLRQLDAGYTRYVTPPQLAFVGALLLAAFAVMLACGLLLLFGRRSPIVWLPLSLVAAGLTAGAVWAGVQGELHPFLWVFFFFGLVYATGVALVSVLRVTRTERRGTIAPP